MTCHAGWTGVVEVVDEPDHVELAVGPWLRVYRATIAAGGSTLPHRHTINTRYVVTKGGKIRSEELPQGGGHTSVGRSTPQLVKLRWVLARVFGKGWIDLPSGTVLIQPHAEHPLQHRVYGAQANPGPVQMIGVELRHDGPASARWPMSGQLEHRDRQAAVSTVVIGPGETIPTHDLTHGAALIVITGDCQIDGKLAVACDAVLLAPSPHEVIAGTDGCTFVTVTP